MGVGFLVRKCYFERTLWWLTRLETTLKSSYNDFFEGISNNFPTLFERTIDVLSLFIGLDNNYQSNNTEQVMWSHDIRETVEQLLDKAKSFANISLESDKVPINILSKNVLTLTIEFEKEFLLEMTGDNFSDPKHRMKAINLESSLYALETFMSNAFLRLVYETFHVEGKITIKEFRSAPTANDSSFLELEIEKFGLYIKRLVQIGRFAISTCRDDSQPTVIMSCLSTIESMYSYLVPPVIGIYDPSIKVLENHLEEEIKLLQNHIQEIIDTVSFCSILMEKLDEAIKNSQHKFDRKLLIDHLQQANVLLHHFNINIKSLHLLTDKTAKFHFNDFKLMLKECDAILNCPEPLEDSERRVLKRFNILNNTIKKLQTVIKIYNSFDDTLSSECLENFNRMQLTEMNSILHDTESSLKNFGESSISSKPSVSKVQFFKRTQHSLRTTIFKKHHASQTDNKWLQDEQPNETMNLQITEILDKLTDISTAPP